jgi:hypothetical protein
MTIKRPEGGEHHEPPKEQQDEQKETEKPVQEILEEWIEFPRVKILREDEETYTVEYNGEEVTINKAEMEHQGGAYYSSGGSPTIELRQQMQQVLQPMHGLFLDREIPQEFREAIIFHELREREYSGFEDAHQRAVHDEILYVLKHFSPELRKQYFEFAEKEREEKSPQREINPEELFQLIEANGLEIMGHDFEEDEEQENKLIANWANGIEVVLEENRLGVEALIEIEEDVKGNYKASIYIGSERDPEASLKFDNRNPRTLQRSVSKIAEKAKALLEEANKTEQK